MDSNIQYKQFTELDFQNIKTSLKTYLQGQDQFKDFDFEGSAINVILNLLAYNTQYNSYYMNMMASEKFISTAQKRESVVGAANNIGYVPYSRKSSHAEVSFTITPDVGYTSSITIPKNTKFTSNISGVIYTFLTDTTNTISPVDGVYTASNIILREGKLFTHKFTVASTDKFLKIPNIGVDYTRLTVYVKQSASDSSATLYSKYSSLVDLTSSSTVYFIQEGAGGYYELYFGDGILGKALSTGNQVIVEYYITEGSVPNGAKVFTLEDEVTGLSYITFTNVVSASGGAMEESTNSIRISAPTNYQAQNRAITEFDFEVLVKQLYPNARAVSATGGEKMTPKQYGKVFISVINNDLKILSNVDKENLKMDLATYYTGLTVYPEIIDPYVVRMYINTTVKYSNIGITEGDIVTAVFNSIKNLTATDLSSFKYVLRKSKFTSMIDSTHPNILSNTSNFVLYIDTNDTVLVSGSKSINFNQPINKKSLASTPFLYKTLNNCIFEDVDGLGFADIYLKSASGESTLVVKNMLSIDYASGLVTYTDNAFTFNQLAVANSGGIKIKATPSSDDVIIDNNMVIFVRDDDITITPIVDA